MPYARTRKQTTSIFQLQQNQRHQFQNRATEKAKKVVEGK
jgi:hypothetical protein